MADSQHGARAGDDCSRRRTAGGGPGFIDLIRGHVYKENNILFNMADQLITGPACSTLCGAYGVACQRRFEGRTGTNWRRW